MSVLTYRFLTTIAIFIFSIFNWHFMVAWRINKVNNTDQHLKVNKTYYCAVNKNIKFYSLVQVWPR